MQNYYLNFSINIKMDKTKPDLKEWVLKNLVKRKTTNPHHTSYGLKHIAEQEIGRYVSNEEFHKTMIEAGFKAEYLGFNENASFNISQKRKDRTKLN